MSCLLSSLVAEAFKVYDCFLSSLVPEAFKLWNLFILKFGCRSTSIFKFYCLQFVFKQNKISLQGNALEFYIYIISSSHLFFLSCTQITLKFHSFCNSLTDGRLISGSDKKCCFSFVYVLEKASCNPMVSYVFVKARSHFIDKCFSPPE